ncbi:dienelactone hydrolase [Paenibacillus sp. V4I3]|uniref:dienelactone hydrolase family protein n=1 Tax=unclassified Paenibacillus TaxID=185978 RepID=UPI002785C029|nr:MULTISPECIES: alpha/beta hydrolase family protein [unclassified Paenibacillus]MDQ0873971.1 dienelactone hydrolase [Paenibacillus sp. V4I3]MDQ0890154.1 dienelactone hydrolase [Paenibacillus sp. V4I9]
MWNPDSIMENLYQSYENKRLQQKRDENVEQTKIRLKRHLVKSLDIALEEQDELRPVLLERTELEDHFRERIEFGTVWGFRVPAFVLLPKGLTERRAAVLALHGHGYGSRQIVGLHPDGTENTGKPDLHGNYALELVKRGFIVVVPEIIGFGDRRLAADQKDGQVGNSSCQTLASHLLLYGISLAGLRVQEARRALDYVLSREDVDPARVGCFGFSGGGLVAAYTAAIDERIKATVLCAFVNTFKGSIMQIRHCIDNYLPSVLEYSELPELLGLLVPRPLFIESGQQDPIFPIKTVETAIRYLRQVYAEAGAGEMLGVHLFEGVHEVNGSQAYPWLVEALES